MCEKNQNSMMMELDDNQLEEVVGGISAGDRVWVDPHMICYCPKCCRLINGGAKVLAYEGAMSNGTKIYKIRLDCCGYETRAAEYTLTVQ